MTHRELHTIEERVRRKVASGKDQQRLIEEIKRLWQLSDIIGQMDERSFTDGERSAAVNDE